MSSNSRCVLSQCNTRLTLHLAKPAFRYNENFVMEGSFTVIHDFSPAQGKLLSLFSTHTQVPSVPLRGHRGQQPLYLVHLDFDQNRTCMINRFGVYYRYLFHHFLRKEDCHFVKSILLIKQHYIYHYTREAHRFNSTGQHVYFRTICNI